MKKTRFKLFDVVYEVPIEKEMWNGLLQSWKQEKCINCNITYQQNSSHGVYVFFKYKDDETRG